MVKRQHARHLGESEKSLPRSNLATVKVNFETHEVFVNGEMVRMTPKELKLLRYFVENQGRVISRNELLTEVWDLAGNLQTRAVDQFIARLRKIIEPDTAAPVHLLTIRDAGYRFVHPRHSSPMKTTATPAAVGIRLATAHKKSSRKVRCPRGAEDDALKFREPVDLEFDRGIRILAMSRRTIFQLGDNAVQPLPCN